MIEHKLKEYILLAEKYSQTNQDSSSTILLAGLQATLSCSKKNINLDNIVEELYKHLDQSDKSLDDYIKFTTLLDNLNVPITTKEVSLLLAGIDSMQTTESFSQDICDNNLDFFCLLKIVTKFYSQISEKEHEMENIEINESDFTDDVDKLKKSTKTKKKFWMKLWFKFLKLAAHIAILQNYFSRMLIHAAEHLKNNFNILQDSNRKFYKKYAFVFKMSKKTIKIVKEINSFTGKTKKSLYDEYLKLEKLCKQLHNLENDLKYNVKLEDAAQILTQNNQILNHFCNKENSHLFANLEYNQEKQDAFSGLVGVLNTRPELSTFRISLNDMFSDINDELLMQIINICVNIAHAIDQQQQNLRYIKQPGNIEPNNIAVAY